jgi:hypothetical protein
MFIYYKVLRTRLFPLEINIISKREEPTELSSIGEAKPRRVSYVLPVDRTDLGTYAVPEANSMYKL